MKFNAAKIRELREGKQWTTSRLVLEIAKVLDADAVHATTTVESWEEGKTIPNADHLAELARVFNVSLSTFFVEE